MSAETKALVQRGIKWQVVGGVAAVAWLAVWVALSYSSTPGLNVIMWSVIILSVVSAYWLYNRAQGIENDLEATYGSASVPVERLRMGRYFQQFVVYTLLAFMLPFVFISPTMATNTGWPDLLMGSVWLPVAIVYIVLLLRTEQRYWRLLPAHELRSLLAKKVAMLHITLPFHLLPALMIALSLYVEGFTLGSVFPPDSAREWVVGIGALSPLFLTGAFVVNGWRYWQARRLLNRKVRV